MKAHARHSLDAGNAGAPPILVISWLWLGFILLWESTGADSWVVKQLADSHGFALQNDWWLCVVLHDGLRRISTLAYFALVLAVWKPFGFLRSVTQRQRVEILAGVTASLLAVNWLKHMSLTSCPWDLAEFGGVAQYVSHWAWGLSDGGAGHCFPSGHASAGYAFLGLALPLLFAVSALTQRRGRRIFAAAFLLGLVCGIAQVLRGAHYPSHVFWAGLICWMVALINHWIFEYSAKAAAVSGGQTASR